MVAIRSTWRASCAIALSLVVSSGCVGVAYQGHGQDITPREGKTLVFGRLRFFHNDHEFFPWNVDLIPPPAGTDTERHVWLLRLTGRAVSAELHPDPDGSLAIWLASGDYALIGSTQLPEAGTAPYEVVALLRVPAAPAAAYAGDLILRTESREGWYASHSGLGVSSAVVLPIDTARATLERRHGTLPEPPVVSPWCAGDDLPRFNDSRLATRARDLLDRGCHEGT